MDTNLARGAVRAHDLVLVDLPPGPAWLHVVPQIWAAGAAFMPADRRLAPPEAEGLNASARPTAELTEIGGALIVRRLDGEPVERDVALVVHTSGTGGAPRLAQFGHAAIASAVATSSDVLGATHRDRWWCCLPLSHIGGLLVVLRGVLLGAPVTIHPRFDPVEIPNEPDIAFTSLVPTMLHRLIDAGIELGSFRAILVGGAEIDPADRERVGPNVIQTYGLTESCGGVVYDGRPLPGTELRLGTGGEIELRGPTLMRGYRDEERATAEAFTPDGWLVTGDVGELGPDGLRVLGRIDDLIVSGGEKVWPSEVERALLAHPKVHDAAAAGRPDREWGRRVTAWVVPADPSDPPSLEELRASAEGTLAGHKAPRELILVHSLPRTSAGKLRRSRLPGGPTDPE